MLYNYENRIVECEILSPISSKTTLPRRCEQNDYIYIYNKLYCTIPRAREDVPVDIRLH